MSARTTRIRRSIVLAGALGAVAATTAQAVPTLGNLPDFAVGTDLGVSWTPQANDFPNPFFTLKYYRVVAEDLTGPGSVTKLVPGTDSHATLALENGHLYSVKVQAGGIYDLPGPPPPTGYAGSFSADDLVRMDATAPTGTMQVNGGAAFTNSRDVTLDVTATDPLSAGQPASGVSGVQRGENAGFPCSFLLNGDKGGCPVTFAPSVPFTLAEGPDGPRTASAKFRDNAKYTGPFILLGPSGNASSVANDQIVLDRAAPTPSAALSATQVTPGTPITFDATGSSDATSGVDPASYAWTFGDGTAQAGPTVSHTYAQPGTYAGTLAVSDRAGNSASIGFSVVVAAPPAPAGPGGQGASAGTGGGGGTPAPPKLRLSRLKKAGAFRVGRSCAATATVSRKIRVQADMRTTSGRIVRRSSRMGGPGTVKLMMSCPKPGRYVITARASKIVQTLLVRVAK